MPLGDSQRSFMSCSKQQHDAQYKYKFFFLLLLYIIRAKTEEEEEDFLKRCLF